MILETFPEMACYELAIAYQEIGRKPGDFQMYIRYSTDVMEIVDHACNVVTGLLAQDALIVGAVIRIQTA